MEPYHYSSRDRRLRQQNQDTVMCGTLNPRSRGDSDGTVWVTTSRDVRRKPKTLAKTAQGWKALAGDTAKRITDGLRVELIRRDGDIIVCRPLSTTQRLRLPLAALNLKD